MTTARFDSRRQLAIALTATVVMILTLLGAPAMAQDDTFLRIETGSHEAAVNHMARLADGTLITVSDDKTARLWAPDGLQPRGLLLPPIGDGDDGALYAVAASAKAIAIGGRIRDSTGQYAVALYTQAPLAVAGLISKLPEPVTALCFSPSGKALAIGLQGGGVRVVALGTWQVLGQDDQHYDHAVTGLTFDPRGRLLVVADDGTLRVYDPDLTRMTPVALPNGAQGFGVAASPDGRHIAVGDRRRAVVHLLDADRLKIERELEGGTGRAGGLMVVAFGADGRSLYAGGSYVDAAGTLYVRRWILPNGAAVDVPVAHDLISDLLPLPDSILFATAEPSVGRFSADGQIAAVVRSRHIDFRNAGRAGFQLSADGARIRLPIAVSAGATDVMPSEQTIVVDMRARLIEPPVPAPAAALPPFGTGPGPSTLSPAYAAAGGLGVTEWQNSRTARVNGQLIALQEAEMVRAVAVQPTGAGAAVGTDFFVRFMTRQGELWRQPTGSPARAVNVSADGHWVVAGLADGTVRWYRAQDGRPGLTLFVDPPTGRFVIWTPEGFFDHDHRVDGTPDGRSLIGYRFNLPNGRASAFVAIGQLYPRFFRPDLVGLTFRGDDAARRIVANETSLLGTARNALAEGLPPSVAVLEACALARDASPTGCDGQATVALDGPAAVPTGLLRLRYRLTDPSGHVGSVVISNNNAVLRPDTQIESASDSIRVEQATFQLGHGRNQVTLAPVNNTGGVEAAAGGRVTLTLDRSGATRSTSGHAETAGPSAPAERPTTRLYVLTVGVNETGNPAWELANPANDARAVAALMRTPAPGVADSIESIALVDPKATANGILAAIHHIAASATPDDLVMIYLAGHGRTVDGHYYFAPDDLGRHDLSLVQHVRDKSLSDDEYDRTVDVLFRTEGLGQEQLLAEIQNIQATRIALVLDTCYSATLADQDTVLRRDVNSTVTQRIGHSSGRFILSGSFAQAYDSDGSQVETEPDGHGLFTSVLLKALRGEADGSGHVDISKLATFTKQEVQQKSLDHYPHVQIPAYFFSGNDFFALR